MDRRREPLPTRVEDTPPLPEAFDHTLADGLARLGEALPPTALAAIAGHVRLVLAWTTSINLTAIRDPEVVATAHVLDSLTALPLIVARRPPPRRLLDLGSGAGFPGLPLAVALATSDMPTHVTLLESVAKKARFLSTAVSALELHDRVDVVARRAEDLARDPGQRGRWDVVTARAVGRMAELVELAFPLLGPGGSLIAWKRGKVGDELDAADRAMEALAGGRLDVEEVGLELLAGHRLVVATRRGDAPVSAIYPRDPAVRRRRPW